MAVWSPQSPIWTKEEQQLLPSQIVQLPSVTLETLLEKSETFPRKFPIDTGRCKTLKTFLNRDILERNINSVYPILHENVLHLYANFLFHKRQHGNDVEKAIYQDMDVLQFIHRLLTKRAVTFMGKWDFWILLNGKKGTGKWESVGTAKEKAPLILKDCLSYEEIKLSAFLSVSSYTYFVNVGDRKNFGVYQTNRDSIQDEGVIIGIIGPRLVKPNVMEYQEMVITEAQNTIDNGYGEVTPPTIHHLFAKLYEEDCLDYKDIKDKESSRYTNLINGEILDNLVYSKRVLFTIDTLFMEANYRASKKNTTAYIHLVGIGLGVWQKHPCQNKLFMDTCGNRIKALGPKLSHVSDICFAYMQHDCCLNYKQGDTIAIEGHPCEGIKIHICQREPHSKLTGSDQGKLLVVSYAWDGNSLPGNEFWNGKLAGSGDSAAASSTQIAELHNPFINPLVCAAGTKVVTKDQVLELEEYVKLVKKE